MIRRTPRGDLIATRHTRSTRQWFHLPPGTPLEKITVAMAPTISTAERQRLRLLRGEAEPDLREMDRTHNRVANGLVLDELLRLLRLSGQREG
jgi:hypothetical protein